MLSLKDLIAAKEARRIKREEKKRAAKKLPPEVAVEVKVNPETSLFDRYSPRRWEQINAPTLVDANGVRYEVAEEGDTYLFCFAKRPSQQMMALGCMFCKGPHTNTNKACNVTKSMPPPYIPPDRLMVMRNQELYPHIVTPRLIDMNAEGHAGRVVFTKGFKCP